MKENALQHEHFNTYSVILYAIHVSTKNNNKN